MDADELVTAADDGNKVPPNAVGILVRLVNLFGILAIAGSAFSLAANQYWIADLAVQFRVQYLIMLLPAIVVWVRKRRSKLSIIGGLALAANLWPVIPYLIPYGYSTAATPELSDPDQTSFRILVVNVLRTNESLKATLDEILNENVDFVFLMEVAPAWKSPLEGLLDRYPHQKLICRDDYTGVAFLSRYAWDHLEVVDTNDANPPLDIFFASLVGQPGPFRLIATHPLPPFGPSMTAARDRQLNTLAKRCQLKQATLLVGDFNLTPWSPRFRQMVDAGGLQDASLGYGISPTLTPLPTLIGGLKVDHVLVNSGIIIRNYQLKPCAHSDHKLVTVDFTIARPDHEPAL